MMKIHTVLFLFVPIVLLAAFFPVVGFSATLEVSIVTPLASGEPYEPHLFHREVFWSGRNRLENGENLYRLEAYSADGSKLLGSKVLKHSVNHVYPFGPEKVLVTGKNYSNELGYQTFYTTATFLGGKLIAQTVSLPLEIQVDQFGGDPEHMYFTEVGERAVYEWKGGQAVKLPFEISGPGALIFSNQKLFVVERNSVFPGDENVVAYDFKTKVATRLFPKGSLRNHLVKMQLLEHSQLLAISEAEADQVLLVDPITFQLKQTLSVKNGPWSLADYGNCLVALTLGDQKLHFLDGAQAFSHIEEWDLSVLGSHFVSMRALAVNKHSGRFFIRSIFRPEIPNGETGVKAVRDPSGLTQEKCLIKN